ncbi:AtpZ/AtpI family protein [Asticcacaulis excentricus]|uniref:ATP synthase protein I n=1 Tax=Asticcacaulis excentricus TaxID=78587 RepID=A0A3G9FXQ9_9CAUL|nr:AtpZ/AtpI family protein [Asticcacaulis excentricus]BBF79820.1 ATP synthase protein I [Asticcacaulis excentricus]
MNNDPDHETSSKLDDLERRLNAIEQKKRRKETDHAESEAGAGKGYQALGELLGGIFIGLGLGWLSDEHLHTRPFGMIVGAIVGLITGVYAVVRSGQR